MKQLLLRFLPRQAGGKKAYKRISSYSIDLIDRRYGDKHRCFTYEEVWLHPAGSLSADGRSLTEEEKEEVLEAHGKILAANPLEESRIKFYSSAADIGVRMIMAFPENPEAMFDLVVSINYDAFAEISIENLAHATKRASGTFALYVRGPSEKEKPSFEAKLREVMAAISALRWEQSVRVLIFSGDMPQDKETGFVSDGYGKLVEFNDFIWQNHSNMKLDTSF